MNDLIKKIVFSVYYLGIIFLSVNTFNIKELGLLHEVFDDKDKLMHFIQYFIFVILAFFAFKIDANIKNFISVCLFIIFSSGIAEFVQLYLPNRDSSYMDCLYDISGGMCGFFIFLGINRICYKD